MSLDPSNSGAPERPKNRSSEEWRMRALIVPELRKRWPGARIIHELPLRYSTNRIDLAAVTEDKIVAVEIKSSRDVTDRLEAQLRGFAPVSHRIIVALAPKWLARGEGAWESETECLIRRATAAFSRAAVWQVNADSGCIGFPSYGDFERRENRPWASRMLDILHVEELKDIAARNRCASFGPRARHDDLVGALNDLMTGREMTRAVCRALRARAAFAKESDPPIVDGPPAPVASPIAPRLPLDGGAA